VPPWFTLVAVAATKASHAADRAAATTPGLARRLGARNASSNAATSATAAKTGTCGSRPTFESMSTVAYSRSVTQCTSPVEANRVGVPSRTR